MNSFFINFYFSWEIPENKNAMKFFFTEISWKQKITQKKGTIFSFKKDYWKQKPFEYCTFLQKFCEKKLKHCIFIHSNDLSTLNRYLKMQKDYDIYLSILIQRNTGMKWSKKILLKLNSIFCSILQPVKSLINIIHYTK